MISRHPIRFTPAGVVVVAALLVGAAACSSSSSGGSSASAPTVVPAAEVNAYVAAVQKVRLPVNTLLLKADPITDAYRERKITPTQASKRMSALEYAFARYAVEAQEISPTNPQLAAINRPYADTYFYEDSYLATLASDLREGDFDNLPNTQDQQRLAIIIWRTKLEVIANRSGVTLPADLQQAGRGEIAPDAPTESGKSSKPGSTNAS